MENMRAWTLMMEMDPCNFQTSTDHPNFLSQGHIQSLVFVLRQARRKEKHTTKAPHHSQMTISSRITTQINMLKSRNNCITVLKASSWKRRCPEWKFPSSRNLAIRDHSIIPTSLHHLQKMRWTLILIVLMENDLSKWRFLKHMKTIETCYCRWRVALTTMVEIVGYMDLEKDVDWLGTSSSSTLNRKRRKWRMQFNQRLKRPSK